MAYNIRQHPPRGVLDDYDAPTGRRMSLDTEDAELAAFRKKRGQLFPNSDFAFFSSPLRGYAVDYHRSSTENAMFEGYYEDDQPQHDPLVWHPQNASTEREVIHSESMGIADCPMLDIVDPSTTATEVMRAGSLFSSSIAEGTGGNQQSSQRFTADAMQVCDKEPTTIPPARCVVAQIDQDIQDAQDTHDQDTHDQDTHDQDTQDTQVTQDIGQMYEQTYKQSDQEGLEDGIKKELEKALEKEKDQLDARETTPLSAESPQPSSPESCSGDSSDSTAAITTETAKMTLNDRLTRRRRTDYHRRKKNKRGKRTAQGMGPPPRPLQPMPERALLPKNRQGHLPIETPPPQKTRADKKKYTDEQKENQRASRAAGTCTHCRKNKRNCDLAKQQPGGTCTSCAKRNAKLKAGAAPLTCSSWKEAASQPPPSA